MRVADLVGMRARVMEALESATRPGGEARATRALRGCGSHKWTKLHKPTTLSSPALIHSTPVYATRSELPQLRRNSSFKRPAFHMTFEISSSSTLYTIELGVRHIKSTVTHRSTVQHEFIQRGVDSKFPQSILQFKFHNLLTPCTSASMGRAAGLGVLVPQCTQLYQGNPVRRRRSE
jgi:hypothetical protein